ncbi:hypothetical protein PROFUN_00181 [Planoprotostelium fungivorum]|uniref:Uncharacterized protein n=1 Tax=Planoprotostelium fungivorum TaxID=1890364 RepID=A0A2P6P0X8_9EUKA|nr:hypothetical protein PROFUN_00181 [Planoprotostelium fungivorum]
MKRQKLQEENVVSVSPEELALHVLKAMDAAVVIRCSSEGTYNIVFTSDRARGTLPHFIADIHQQGPSSGLFSDDVTRFWRTVRSVAITGIPTKTDMKSESNITTKFQKIVILDQTYVVISLKQTKEGKQVVPFLNHGPTDEHLVTYLCDAIENDIIGLTLGVDCLYVQLTSHVILQLSPIAHIHQMWEPGVVTYYAVNPNTARMCGIAPHMARGKTSVELNRSKPELIRAASLSDETLDPVSQRSSFNMNMGSDTTLFMEMKRDPDVMQITPELYLNIMIVRRGQANKRPQSIVDKKGVVAESYKKHQWETLLEDILRFVSENVQYASTTKLEIPDEFFRNSQNIFCYIYHGSFLPSRSADGFQWKSSFCAPSPGHLQKRYFYHKTEGHRMRRRIMWIESLPQLQIIEYRHLDHYGEVVTDHLIGPEMMSSWPFLISQVTHREDYKLQNAMEEIDKEFNMGALRGEVPYEEIQDSTQVLSYVSGILNNWAVRHRNNPPSSPSH